MGTLGGHGGRVFYMRLRLYCLICLRITMFSSQKDTKDGPGYNRFSLIEVVHF